MLDVLTGWEVVDGLTVVTTAGATVVETDPSSPPPEPPHEATRRSEIATTIIRVDTPLVTPRLPMSCCAPTVPILGLRSERAFTRTVDFLKEEPTSG